MLWDGSFPDYSGWNTFSPLRGNLLFIRLLDNYMDEITARYEELRSDVLSAANIERQFSSFIGQIPELVYAADAEKWPGAPGRSQNDLTQITNFAQWHTEGLGRMVHRQGAHRERGGRIAPRLRK